MITIIVIVALLVTLILLVLVWELRHTFQPGKIWVAVLGKDQKFRWYFVKPKGNELRVHTKHGWQKYLLNTENLVRTGKYNIPVSYHLENKSASINFALLKVDPNDNATKRDEATENHVARDIIQGLTSSPQQIMLTFAIVVCAVVVFAAVAVAMDVRKQVKKLAPINTVDRVESR